MRFFVGLRSFCGLGSQAVPGRGGFTRLAPQVAVLCGPKRLFRRVGGPSRLSDAAHRRARELGDRLRCRAPAEAENPVCQFGVRRLDTPAVDLEEDEHGDQRCALVAVDELLTLRDPVREDGGLERQVRVLVVGIRFGPRDHAFQAGAVCAVCAVGQLPLRRLLR